MTKKQAVFVYMTSFILSYNFQRFHICVTGFITHALKLHTSVSLGSHVSLRLTKNLPAPSPPPQVFIFFNYNHADMK